MTLPLCKLCLEREANKKNTHYLTDAIIRTCLNLHGTNQRERGFYFFSDKKTAPFINFGFQRLDESTLEEKLGRKPTDEEIENAKSIPCSVDNVFCSECEKLFTEIETPFIEKILPHFRQADLSGLETVTEKEVITIRNFFYVQIYRSAICLSGLDFPSEFMEKLRRIILEKNGDISIPLSITYLQTLGGNASYTGNWIMYTSDKNPYIKNPYIICMNDFVIQVYDDFGNIKFEPFYGLNENDNFRTYINMNEDRFIFRILDDAKRKTFLDNISKEKIKETLQYYRYIFNAGWRKSFGVDAPVWEIDCYKHYLINSNQNNPIKYSEEQVYKCTVSYMAKRFNVKE